MSSKSEPRRGKGFLQTPTELRIKIYKEVITVNPAMERIPRSYKGLYLSCRQINAEMQYELVQILQRIKSKIESYNGTVYSYTLDIPMLETAPLLNRMRLNVHFPKLEPPLLYPFPHNSVPDLAPLANLGLQKLEILFSQHPDDVTTDTSNEDYELEYAMLEAWRIIPYHYSYWPQQQLFIHYSNGTTSTLAY
jgi:hypothetical protein